MNAYQSVYDYWTMWLLAERAFDECQISISSIAAAVEFPSPRISARTAWPQTQFCKDFWRWTNGGLNCRRVRFYGRDNENRLDFPKEGRHDSRKVGTDDPQSRSAVELAYGNRVSNGHPTPRITHTKLSPLNWPAFILDREQKAHNHQRIPPPIFDLGSYLRGSAQEQIKHKAGWEDTTFRLVVLVAAGFNFVSLGSKWSEFQLR